MFQCSSHCSRHAKIVYNSHHLTLSVATICRRESYDMFRVVHDNRKQVVGLIFVS